MFARRPQARRLQIAKVESLSASNSRAAPKSTAPRAAAAKGSRKAEEARARILDAALHEFGALGFEKATTRTICARADVTLPALQYYFGGKEGLYRACAEEVAGRYGSATGQVVISAMSANYEALTPEMAAEHLRRVLKALAGLLIGTDHARPWTAFVARELNDPGPGFEILFKAVWSPGLDLTARLVARVRGEAAVSRQARVQALMLISSIMAFHTGRNVALRILGVVQIGKAELDDVLVVIDAQIADMMSRCRA